MPSRTAVKRATVDLARLSTTESQQAVGKPGPFTDLAVELVLSIMEIAARAPYVSGSPPFHLLLISRTIHKWLFPMFWDAIQFSSRRENMEKFMKIFSRNDRRRFIGSNVKHVKVTVLRFDADILQPLLEFFPAVRTLEISGVTHLPSVDTHPYQFTMEGRAIQHVNLGRRPLLSHVTHLHVYTNELLVTFCSRAMERLTHIRIEQLSHLREEDERTMRTVQHLLQRPNLEMLVVAVRKSGYKPDRHLNDSLLRRMLSSIEDGRLFVYLIDTRRSLSWPNKLTPGLSPWDRMRAEWREKPWDRYYPRLLKPGWVPGFPGDDADLLS